MPIPLFRVGGGSIRRPVIVPGTTIGSGEPRPVNQARIIQQLHKPLTPSVAARKLSSKFHAKVSRNFWHESLNLFDETFQ